MITLRAASLAVCLLMLIATPAQSGDWTGWLGPQRNGWVGTFQPPDAWPKSLREQWSVDVGSGYGSPLVKGDRVYQHSRQGDEEVVWCLDLTTGETVWRVADDVPFKIAGGGERHGKGPKSSPTLAGDAIITMSITGVLTARDLSSGDLLWRRDDSQRYPTPKPHPNWGASTSPMVDGELVIVHLGNDDRGQLVALDVQTGEEVWAQGSDGASYSSPVIATIDGVRQVVEWNHNALVGVDISTGERLWEFPAPHIGSDQNMPTPVAHDGLVLLGGENRGIRGLRPTREDGRWIVDELWHQQDVALDMSTAVMNDGLLYGFSHYDSGRLFCLDPASGDILWLGPPRTGNNVMFLSVPGHVIALINNGQLKVIAAKGPATEIVETYTVADSQTWAPPVLLNDGVLIKAQGTLARWSYEP